jgi:hypothetical protein
VKNFTDRERVGGGEKEGRKGGMEGGRKTISKTKKVGHVVQVVECLPRKHKSLSSNPNTA